MTGSWANHHSSRERRTRRTDRMSASRRVSNLEPFMCIASTTDSDD